MRFLGNKEKKALISNLSVGVSATKKDKLTENDRIIYKNDIPFLIVMDNVLGGFLPHLKSVSDNVFKSVYVDRGAIPFVIKGADIMRPGIHKIDENIVSDEIIFVKDENFMKILAIGRSLFSSEEMNSLQKGKCVEVLHYVKDKYY